MIWFERIWNDKKPLVKLWIGTSPWVEEPTEIGEEEGTAMKVREPDLVTDKGTVDSFIVEYLRGPMGHPGPTGAPGAVGPPGSPEVP